MLSLFDIFKIGVGPSSSHTTGPMLAAQRFMTSVRQNHERQSDPQTQKVKVRVYGSLALTGLGHRSDMAIMLGLTGLKPVEVDPDEVEERISRVQSQKCIQTRDGQRYVFDPAQDLIFLPEERLPFHTNGMKFELLNADGAVALSEVYYSIGGGFILREDETEQKEKLSDIPSAPNEFKSAHGLLALAEMKNMTIADVVLENELSVRDLDQVHDYIDLISSTMRDCIQRGLHQDGVLPGGLEVKRRAPSLMREIRKKTVSNKPDALAAMDFVNVWAIAVNEENASGGRIVTAPTNGAAGIVPAVLRYYLTYEEGADKEGVRTFLLTATAIGALFKINASISGAEVGCQGEVGSACSMAAAGLAAALGGTNEQIENAAEIGIEHNLGLTCDPIGGLVQIPCIERNAIGAVKAINAARIALNGDGAHTVSLDKAIETMRRTGEDMHEKYKETSQGGLAVSYTEC